MGDVVNNAVSDFRYIEPFQRYLRSKSKSRRIFHVLPSEMLLGPLSKAVPTLSRLLLARRLIKFRKVTHYPQSY